MPDAAHFEKNMLLYKTMKNYNRNFFSQFSHLCCHPESFKTVALQLTCYQDLTDRLLSANQHMQMRHTTLLTAILIPQIRIISNWWTLFCWRGRVERMWVREKNIPNTLSPPQFCQTLHQPVEHSLFCWLVNCSHHCPPCPAIFRLHKGLCACYKLLGWHGLCNVYKTLLQWSQLTVWALLQT